MASKGLRSFDTELIHSPSARYYLVTIPDRPLLLDELPIAIVQLISRTRAPLRFADCPYIDAAETENW